MRPGPTPHPWVGHAAAAGLALLGSQWAPGTWSQWAVPGTESYGLACAQRAYMSQALISLRLG